MQPASCELVDFGIDWYTGTLVAKKSSENLVTKASILMMHEAAAGNEKRAWSMFGYEGFKCGGLQFGTRADGAIIRLSGPTAQEHWSNFHPIMTNCSRLDLQVTLRWSEPSHTKLAKHFKGAMRFHKKGACKRTVALYRSSDQSATIYLGKRESELFGRCYQKDRESGLDHYQNCLRYEMEIKDPRSSRYATHLYHCPSLGPQLFTQVRKYFTDAGIFFPKLEHDQLRKIPASLRLTDDDRSLAWIKQSVQPAIARLIANGKWELVQQALGISSVGPSWSNTAQTEVENRWSN